MRLPEMKYADKIRKSKQIKFGGLNHSNAAGDGDLWDMKNLTSDHYPLLATRQKRLLYRTLESGGGLFSWEKLLWVDGTEVYFDGEAVGQVTEGEKAFASLGAYVVIFPDKCWFHVDTKEFGSLESKWSGASLTFDNGTIYGEEAFANTITCEGVDWSEWFHAGDAVTISGCKKQPGNNKTIIIREIDGDKLTFYENSFTLVGDGTAGYTETGSMKIERTVPDLDFVCENENRLWGCNETTIYACKLGDIFNWNVADGLASDSYSVDTGSAGAFTGCISYLGYPTFFKEDHIYKVYGSIPSNFEVMGSSTLGLAKGCGGSLAIAGETLFYLNRSGIIAYTGGIPQPVGSAFGMERYHNAVGGSDGLKYYVSMENEDDEWSLFVYDTQRGLWHREDDTRITHFARWNGNLYYLNSGGEIWITGNVHCAPGDATEEESIDWVAEFGDFTNEDPNKKGISKLQLRLELEEGAEVEVWLQFDSDGVWRPSGHAVGESAKRSYYLPIVPRRADHYRLKLTGTGGCRVHSLVVEQYSGSELRSRNGRN